MKAIILSAGMSKRFSNAGCPTPKHLLPMPDGRRMIQWHEDRMLSLTSDVTTVVLECHVEATRKYLVGKIATIKRPIGPLDTLFRYIQKRPGVLRTKEPVIVTYNDHVMDLYEYRVLAGLSPWLKAIQVVFRSGADRFNYVSGDLADGGVYKFSSGYVILAAMLRFPPPYSDKVGLHHLIKGIPRKSVMVSSTHVDLGIPEDYKLWMAKKGCPVNDW